MTTKIRTFPENIVHPDTEEGARAALVSAASKAFVKKVARLETADWEWRPADLPGVWRFGEVDEDSFLCGMIVYMAGYNGRTMSDFEESIAE